MDFFSREAGQARRAWLNDKDRAVSQLMRRYLGPTGIPDQLQAAGNALAYTDAGDMVEAADASRALWNDPSVQNAARYATAGAAMAVPFVGAKMMNDGVDVVGDAIASGADDAARFVRGEDGAIRAWHGSPHDFDRFSLDKIGTGEGAQAYGHGLYFAENRGVAENYKRVFEDTDLKGVLNVIGGDGKVLASGNSVTDAMLDAQKFLERGARDAGQFKHNTAYYAKRAAESYLEPGPRLDAALAEIERLKDARFEYKDMPGRLYEVSIDANPEDFLDYDRPLVDQGETAKAALERLGYKANPEGLSQYDDALLAALEGDANAALPPRPRNPSGSDILTAVGESRLREAGIPGIRYLDAGSRGAGDGSRNYVVFDDKLISILNKYGLLGAMMGGGALSQIPQGEQQ